MNVIETIRHNFEERELLLLLQAARITLHDRVQLQRIEEHENYSGSYSHTAKYLGEIRERVDAICTLAENGDGPSFRTLDLKRRYIPEVGDRVRFSKEGPYGVVREAKGGERADQRLYLIELNKFKEWLRREDFELILPEPEPGDKVATRKEQA